MQNLSTVKFSFKHWNSTDSMLLVWSVQCRNPNNPNNDIIRTNVIIGVYSVSEHLHYTWGWINTLIAQWYLSKWLHRNALQEWESGFILKKTLTVWPHTRRKFRVWSCNCHKSLTTAFFCVVKSCKSNFILSAYVLLSCKKQFTGRLHLVNGSFVYLDVCTSAPGTTVCELCPVSACTECERKELERRNIFCT